MVSKSHFQILHSLYLSFWKSNMDQVGEQGGHAPLVLCIIPAPILPLIRTLDRGRQ